MATRPGGSPLQAADMAEVLNPAGTASVVLVCEHAANAVPPAYGTLGLTPDLLDSHIAWDIGARDTAAALAERLDAPLVCARASRLLYDCNRPPEAPDAVPARSEVFDIPGNRDLTPEALAERARLFYEPFRTALAALLDARIAADRPPVVVTLHSFTPVYKGVPRGLDLGILHDADNRLADALLAAADSGTVAGAAGLTVRRNEPYGPADGVTHTLRTQAMARGLPNVMFEIRNTLLTEPPGCRAMAERLEALLRAALPALPAPWGRAATET